MDGSSPNAATVSLSLFTLPSISLHPPSPSSVLQQRQARPSFPVLQFNYFLAMFPFNGLANNACKRKVKEVAAAQPPSAAIDRHSQVQQILNTAAPFKPFSFLPLLTPDNEDNHRNPLFSDIKNQSNEIDQIILLHSENLKQALGGILEKHHQTLCKVAEERAAKKLKEKELELQSKWAHNAELERLVEHYKGEAERLLIRVRYLERAAMSLRTGLREANEARRYAETEQEQEEAESSSFKDPDRVGPVRLDCKVCQRQLATVMMWPCRHVCVCKSCEGGTKLCPVCCLVKRSSVEVCLPLN